MEGKHIVTNPETGRRRAFKTLSAALNFAEKHGLSKNQVMSRPIDEKGFYTGSELKWGTMDVSRILDEMNVTASEDDLERILIASLRDNDAVLQKINEAIEDTITFMTEEGQL